jgi:hypothetical protein
MPVDGRDEDPELGRICGEKSLLRNRPWSPTSRARTPTRRIQRIRDTSGDAPVEARSRGSVA